MLRRKEDEKSRGKREKGEGRVFIEMEEESGEWVTARSVGEW